MPIELPSLPYALDALEPHISATTLELHHQKHHKAYVDKTNALVAGSTLADRPIEEIIVAAASDAGRSALFNNAAQAWNHDFYWRCLSPKGGGEPSGELARDLTAAFGSLAAFRQKFAQAAIGKFGSGWAWLVRNGDGSLEILATTNAETPLRSGKTALLTCDVWEHAYYIDYRNARADYVEAFWELVNWEFVARNDATRRAAVSA